MDDGEFMMKRRALDREIGELEDREDARRRRAQVVADDADMSRRLMRDTLAIVGEDGRLGRGSYTRASEFLRHYPFADVRGTLTETVYKSVSGPAGTINAVEERIPLNEVAEQLLQSLEAGSNDLLPKKEE